MCVNPKVIEARITAIKAATPLTNDMSIILPHQLLVQALAQQLRALLESIERFDKQIALFAASLPDYALFQALPGAGPVFAPRLVSSANVTRVQRKFRNTQELHPSPSAVEKNAGYTGACNAPSSYARPLSNGLPKRFRAPTGRGLIIASSAIRAARIRSPFVHWLLSGFVFSIGAGKTGHLMTSPLT
jgi:hypothetical protein